MNFSNAVPSPSSGMRHNKNNNDEEKEMTAALCLLTNRFVGINSHNHHPHDCSQKTLETLSVEQDGRERSTMTMTMTTNGDFAAVVVAPEEELVQPAQEETAADQHSPRRARFWDFFCSFLVPVLAQGIFGGFSIVRTIVLGYTLQNAMTQVLPAFSEKTMTTTTSTGVVVPPWLATPPPAFIVLALFTVVAFVIHPDGFTWIFLRKSRCVHITSRLGRRQLSFLTCFFLKNLTFLPLGGSFEEMGCCF
jgi:hypothetical protein